MRLVWLGFAVLVVASGVARAKPSGCVVEGKAVDAFAVTVASKGGPSLNVRVRDVAATARLPETGPATVDVRGALAFSGTTPTDKLPLKPKARLDSPNGMLRLGAGAGRIVGAPKGRWIEGDVLLDGIRFKGVRFPCDGLTLDAVAGSAVADVNEGEEGLAPVDKTLTLRFGPGTGPTMVIELANPSDLELYKLEKSPGWTRVFRRFADGTYVNGWAQASALQPHQPGRVELSDLPVSGCAHPPEVRPGTKIVSAPVAAGTAVMFDRLFTWATVKTAAPVTVRYTPGERWVELVGVPGFATADECEAGTVLDEAWVPRAAVKLPDEPTK